MTNRNFAEQCYKKFSSAEGNQHIASLFTLSKIIDFVSLYKPKAILEIGLGIGSVSYTVLSFKKSIHTHFAYFGTEANEFCLSQLPKNLAEYHKEMTIVETIEDIDANNKFDFIIVDGKDDSLSKLTKMVNAHGIVFIEGDRINQVLNIKQLFPKSKHVRVIATYKEPAYSPFDSNNWSGGATIIYLDPNSKQLLQYYVEKGKTFMIYKVRKILKLFYNYRFV